MVLSVSTKIEKQGCRMKYPVAKISEFIGKYQKYNEERRKTYAAVQAML